MASSGKVESALILGLCVLLMIVAKTVVAFTRYAKAERSFASVQIGDSRASVIGKMGKPGTVPPPRSELITAAHRA